LSIALIMARAVGVAAVLAVASAAKVALNTYDQGASFTKCINITDFETKTLADEIDLIDRDANGCCPEYSVPGAKWKANYKGAQVVCGFKADGTVALTTGTTNGNKTCTYNSCYVDKQNLPCADNSTQLLNGCCAATTGSNTGFGAQCKNYYYNFNNAYSKRVQYCTTYDKDYGSLGKAGTPGKTDDQADGKLVVANISTFTLCAGGYGGDATTTTAAAAAATTTTAAAPGDAAGASIAAVSGLLLSVAAAFAIRQ